MDNNNSSSSSPFDRTALGWFLGAVCGLWLLGCLVSTRCCRSWSSNETTHTNRSGGVWDGRFRTQQQRQDYLMARELQRAEAQQSLEASRRFHEQNKKLRVAFVEKVLPGTVLEKAQTPPQSCTICLNAFQMGECITTGTTGDCQHVFHRRCIAEWLIRKPVCPVCRKTFLRQDAAVPCDEEAQNRDHNIDNDDDNNNDDATYVPLPMDVLDGQEG